MKIEESPETNNHIKKVIANGNGEVVNRKCGSPKVKNCNDFESTTKKSDDSPLTNGKTQHVNSEENLNLNNNNIDKNKNQLNDNSTEIKNGDGVVANGTNKTTSSSPTKNGVNEEKTASSTKIKNKDANKSKGNLTEIDKLSDKLNRQKLGKSIVNGEEIKTKKSACNGAITSDKHEQHVAVIVTNGSSSSNNENLNTNGKPVNNKKKQKNVNDIESQNGQTSIANGNCETDHVHEHPINDDVYSKSDLPEKDVSLITKKETRVIKGKVTPVTKSGGNVESEPRVDEKGILQVSSSSQNGESERSDSPASSATSSLSASSSNNINGELVINGDHDSENVEANENQNNSNKDNTKCTENPCASEVKPDYDVLEGPFFGQLNGHSTEEPVIIYQFELAQYLCGRLIGRNGHYVNQIKEKSNASVVVNRHPLTPLYKICSIEGTRSEIRRALRLIRSRFPIYEFPEVTLQQINVISPLLQACQVTVPQSCQLHLPEGVSCDVILSNVVNAGHIFVRQPTHPTYPSLSRLDQFMNATYSVETPPVLAPNPGDICAVNMCSGWYRAMVVNVWDELEVEVKFVDYGGYARAPISSLRQIRYDFMTLPFQASECYLANVKPTDEDQGWSKEANVVFHDLAQGQMLQAKIVAYADDGIPLIHLHKIQGASNIFINQELENRGLAQWVEHQMWE